MKINVSFLVASVKSLEFLRARYKININLKNVTPKLTKRYTEKPKSSVLTLSFISFIVMFCGLYKPTGCHVSADSGMLPAILRRGKV